IGVGSGDLEKMLIDRGVEAFSLDPCAESIIRLQVELNMETRARQGYSQDICFDADFFDKVIMTEVLEHLQEDIVHATLDEVRRVLKSGGEFIGTVPYREDLKASEVFCPHCQAQFHRWGHHKSYDVASLEGLFRQHGFRVKRMYSCGFPDFWRPGGKNFLKAVFRYVLGRMGEQLIGPNLYFVAIPGEKG
ncbi:MAG: class I SAM-dependent methyltransferase, partial [Alphaproteobacteria bacterium]|nr:class I SAM-dependent methyltransferase [Alphaproteobacteria bacterium]